MIADPDYLIKFITEQGVIDYLVVSDAKKNRTKKLNKTAQHVNHLLASFVRVEHEWLGDCLPGSLSGY